jgi:hypothetical protein
MAAHFFQWPSSAQWHSALEAEGHAVPAGWIKPSLKIGRPPLYGMVLSGRCAVQHIKFNIKSTAFYRIKWFNKFESQNILL